MCVGPKSSIGAVHYWEYAKKLSFDIKLFALFTVNLICLIANDLTKAELENEKKMHQEAKYIGKNCSG